jgi:hypothetical protein
MTRMMQMNCDNVFGDNDSTLFEKGKGGLCYYVHEMESLDPSPATSLLVRRE